MLKRINCEAYRVRVGGQIDPLQGLLRGMIVHRTAHGQGKHYIDPTLDERSPVIRDLCRDLRIALNPQDPPPVHNLNHVSQFSIDLDRLVTFNQASILNSIEAHQPVKNLLGRTALSSLAFVSVIDRSAHAIKTGEAKILQMSEHVDHVQDCHLKDSDELGAGVSVLFMPLKSSVVFESTAIYSLFYNPSRHQDDRQLGLHIEQVK